MATPSEIIMSRDLQRLPVSRRVHNVVDTTQGLTDALYNTEIMRTLGKTAPAYLEESEWNEKPIVPDLKSVLYKLGIKAKDDPTGVKAARKFVEDFPKERRAWKKMVENDPAFGTRGWETVYDMFKQTSNDLMHYDIAENRRKAARGLDEKGDIKDPAQWVWSKAAALFTPRSLKAYEAGREPTASEILRDAGANALYALPFGTGARALTVGAPAAVKGVANLASQAIAPSVVAGIDVASDPDYSAKEGIADAGIGTLTNLGINKFIAPLIAGRMAASQGAIETGPFMRSVREALEDMPTLKEKATETVKSARTILGDATTPSAEKAAARDVMTVDDLSKIRSASNTIRAALSAEKAAAKEAAAANKQALKTHGIVHTTKGYDPAKVIGEAAEQFAYDVLESRPIPKYKETLERNPELVGLFDNDLARQLASPANILKVYGVNLTGNNLPEAAASTGVDIKPLLELKKEAAEDRAAKASDVLGKSGRSDITEEDEKYLRMISENPDILQFSQDDGFKIWLLKRGHRLLQGTPAHRPLWEVK